MRHEMSDGGKDWNVVARLQRWSRRKVVRENRTFLNVVSYVEKLAEYAWSNLLVLGRVAVGGCPPRLPQINTFAVTGGRQGDSSPAIGLSSLLLLSDWIKARRRNRPQEDNQAIHRRGCGRVNALWQCRKHRLHARTTVLRQAVTHCS